jgi:hypothetical protein
MPGVWPTDTPHGAARAIVLDEGSSDAVHFAEWQPARIAARDW